MIGSENANWVDTGWVVTEFGPGCDWRARCVTDPRLEGVVWWWTPGTGQVEFCFGGAPAVGVVNVWDYDAGMASVSTMEELAAHLADRYSDRGVVDDLLRELSEGTMYG